MTQSMTSFCKAPGLSTCTSEPSSLRTRRVACAPLACAGEVRAHRLTRPTAASMASWSSAVSLSARSSAAAAGIPCVCRRARTDATQRLWLDTASPLLCSAKVPSMASAQSQRAAPAKKKNSASCSARPQGRRGLACRSPGSCCIP